MREVRLDLRVTVTRSETWPMGPGRISQLHDCILYATGVQEYACVYIYTAFIIMYNTVPVILPSYSYPAQLPGPFTLTFHG